MAKAFMHIGPLTLAKAMHQVGSLLEKYKIAIDVAYTKADCQLDIDFKVKLRADRKGTKVLSAISFVESRVKDGEGETVNESQLEMFPGADDVKVSVVEG